VTVLRALLGLAGAAVAVASLVVDRPEVFLLVTPACLVLFLVGCGLAASDAIPVQRLPLAASLLAAVIGVLVATRVDQAVAVALGVLVAAAQAAAWWHERAARPSPR
jgi:hypothetical protein